MKRRKIENGTSEQQKQRKVINQTGKEETKERGKEET
jgi:hypothetical protein